MDNLDGFPNLRLHYLDEGLPTAENIFLCLHGEPTWSYLYRKMIPVFTGAGHRVLAPDFFGFGRSDKPAEEDIYSFDFHRNTIITFIRQLNLSCITLVCQDWGGIIGLTLPMEMPKRFRRLIVMNTTLGTGDFPLGDGFLSWRSWVSKNPDMDVAKLMQRACPQMTTPESAAYAAPFPDSRYKAGVRQFPQLVPDQPKASGAAVSRQAREWLSQKWSGETFMAIGAADPVLGPPVMNALKKSIQGCPEPLIIDEAGHFVQEWGDLVAQRALEAFDLTR